MQEQGCCGKQKKKSQSTQTHRSTITTLQTKHHTSSPLLTFCAEKEVCDVCGVVDADADADDEHRRGDRVYRQIWKEERGIERRL